MRRRERRPEGRGPVWVGAGRRGPARRRPAPLTVLGLVLGAGIPLAFVGVFFIWPVLGMIGRGFLPDGALDLSGVAEVFSRPRTLRLVGQTLLQAGSATLLALLVGLPLAGALYRRRFAGRSLLRALITLPFVMPSVVVGIAFRTLFREGGFLGFLHLDGTQIAVVLALAFFNIAVVVRTVGLSWESLDARMEEAARVLGASPATVFRTVTLPRLLPSLAAAAAIIFLFCATAFGVVLTIGGVGVGTIETEIYLQTVQFLDLRVASVLSVVQLLIVIGLLLVAGRARAGRRGPERRSGVAHVVRPARLSDLPGILAAVLAATLLMLPILTLVWRSLQVDGEWSLHNYLALGSTGSSNALSVTVWEALANSLRMASLATLIAVLIGLAASLVLSRRPSRGWRRLLSGLDHSLMLPLGVSAVTVGLGILITLNHPPFDLRSSPILTPVAQAIVALPLVLRTLLPTLQGIDPRLRESAAVLGAAPWRVLRDVDVVLVSRPLLAASGFAFAVCLGEFGATAFLSRPDEPTLPVVIHRLISTPGPGNAGMALAAAVILAVLTVLVMTAVERLRVGRVGAF